MRYSNHRRLKPKSNQRRNMIFGVICIILMLTSILAFLGLSNESSGSLQEYGHRFSSVYEDGGTFLSARFNGEPISFTRLPSAVAYVDISASVSLVRNAQAVGIIFTPLPAQDQTIINHAAFRFTQDFAEKAISYGVTVNESVFDFPQVTCENATIQRPLVNLQLTNITGIQQQDNCITISGETPDDLLSAVERFRFEYHGLDFAGEIDG